MKHLNFLFLPLLLSQSCTGERPAPALRASIKLQSEEYFADDAKGPGSTGVFVPLYKKKYRYDQDKLVGIDAYDFNPNTNAYDSGHKEAEYQYTNDGKLGQSIEFIGTSGLRFIKTYEYPTETITRVTRYESTSGGDKNLQDLWIMERTPSLLTVKYYQGNNELYGQLIYAIDEKGNVISLTMDPAFPAGRIYYEHDNSPNPYKFPELRGEYSERYLSENNTLAVTNDLSGKSTHTIEYDDSGYPITIETSTSRTVLTYQ